MKKKRVSMILIVSIIMFIMANSIMTTQARQIEDFENFVIYYKGAATQEKYTGYLKKTTKSKYAVLNLEPTRANKKVVVATLRNSKNQSRGRIIMYVGTRKKFKTTGCVNGKYKMGIKLKDGRRGRRAIIFGSWSPDALRQES